MGFKANRVTVTTSATPLVSGVTRTGTTGDSILIRNVSGREVRTGGADVTWALGMPLLDGEVKSYTTPGYDLPYAIVDAGTAEVAVEQEGV